MFFTLQTIRLPIKTGKIKYYSCKFDNFLRCPSSLPSHSSEGRWDPQHVYRHLTQERPCWFSHLPLVRRKVFQADVYLGSKRINEGAVPQGMSPKSAMVPDYHYIRVNAMYFSSLQTDQVNCTVVSICYYYTSRLNKIISQCCKCVHRFSREGQYFVT